MPKRSTRTRSRASCGSPMRCSTPSARISAASSSSAAGSACSPRYCCTTPASRSRRSRASMSTRAARVSRLRSTLTHVRAGKFAAVTADMLDYDYAGAANAAGAPNLVVNTSCEHLEAFDRWYGRIPGRPAAGAAVQRLFRVQRARQLRARSRGIPGAGADARRALRRRAQAPPLRALHADRPEVSAAHRPEPNADATSSHAAPRFARAGNELGNEVASPRRSCRDDA